MAERGDYFPPEAALGLDEKLRPIGKHVTLTVYPRTGDAFMGPHKAMGPLDENLAARIWPEVLSFLHDKFD